jgi:hypothetical protein
LRVDNQQICEFTQLFSDASTREIGFLNEDSATQLITQPAQGILEYEPKRFKPLLNYQQDTPIYSSHLLCYFC